MSASRIARLVDRARREQDGGFLIEIIVSFAILLVVAGGVLTAFQTSTEASSQQRAQAVAATLAATEMDRLRSLKFTDLAGLDVTRQDVIVGNNTFDIRSQSGEGLASQPTGERCDNASRSAETLRLTTTVTWDGQGSRRPVRLTSMIAAPANVNSSRGSVVVQVVDRDGAGVSGLSVTISGTSTAVGSTDDNGCVRFTDLIPRTDYRIRFNRTGWKTPTGINMVDLGVDVVAGVTQTKSVQYDPPGPVSGTFFYRPNGDPLPGIDAPQRSATWIGGALTSPQTRTLSPPSALVTDTLPESATPYGLYATSCAANQPPSGQLGSVPSDGTPARVEVPTLRVNVKDAGGNNQIGAQVFVTVCGGRLDLGTTNSSGNATGGVPYAPAAAPLTVCAQRTIWGTTYRVSGTATATTYFPTDNTVNLRAASSPPTGPCP